MEGISILYQEPIMTIPNWAGILVIILIAGIFGGMAIGICADTFSVWGWIWPLVSLFCLITLGILATIDPQISTNRTKYYVTIDESISMTDFYEKYEVIEQKGELWILEDKEIDE